MQDILYFTNLCVWEREIDLWMLDRNRSVTRGACGSQNIIGNNLKAMLEEKREKTKCVGGM